MFKKIPNKELMRLQYFVIFFSIVILIFGIFKARSMPIDILPEFKTPTIEIQTEALGLSASEVENFITINLEEMLTNTPWLEEMRSQSVPGLSSIVLKFEPGTDIMEARQMVSENLAHINDIPNVSQGTIILQPRSSTNRVMAVGLSSKELSLIDISELSRWNIKPALMSVSGVANVSIWGHRERQFQVQFDQEKARNNGVYLDKIINTTGNAFWMSQLTFLEASTPGSGGWVDTPNQRLGIRHVLPIQNEKDLAETPIPNRGYLSLGDVSDNVEGHQPLIGDAVVNNDKGILLVIEKYPNSGVLEVTRGVEKKLKELKTGLAGIEINTNIFRPATFIESMIKNLINVFSVSFLLISFLFFVIFRRLRTALIALSAIIVSLTTSLFVLYVCGATVNTIMIAGIVASLAIVIDQIINGFNNRIRGTVYTTIIAASLVLPIFFIQNEIGLFLEPLGLSYILSIFGGLLFALFFVPAAVNIFSSKEDNKKLYREFSFIQKIHTFYLNRLKRIVNKSIIVWLIIIVLWAVSCVAWFSFDKNSLLPVFKEQNLSIEVSAVPGTSHTEMERIVTRISNKLSSVSGVDNVGAHMGRAVTGDEITDMSSAKIWISIDQDSTYTKVKKDVLNILSGYAGMIRNVNSYSQEIMKKHLTDNEEEMFVRVYGSEFDILKEYAREIRKDLSRINGISDPKISDLYKKPGIEIKVNKSSAAMHGLKPGDVRRTAATLINGLEVGNRFREQKVYQVIVWSTPETRNSPDDIENLLIETPNGYPVHLGDVADVNIVPTIGKIKREGMSRYIDINFDLRGSNYDEVSENIEKVIQRTEFPLEYHAEVIREYKEKQEMKNDVLVIAIVIMIGIFFLLESFFNSWRLATLSFITIPTALSGGVFAAYFASGGVLSLGSLVGFLTILGVSARNGIMLIGHFQYLEDEEGESFGLALILRGAKERLTPILMTTFTTGVALIPLVIAGNIPGHEIEHPMAIVILGGLITSTVINIFIVPALYFWFGKKLTSNSINHNYEI